MKRYLIPNCQPLQPYRAYPSAPTEVNKHVSVDETGHSERDMAPRTNKLAAMHSDEIDALQRWVPSYFAEAYYDV